MLNVCTITLRGSSYTLCMLEWMPESSSLFEDRAFLDMDEWRAVAPRGFSSRGNGCRRRKLAVRITKSTNIVVGEVFKSQEKQERDAPTKVRSDNLLSFSEKHAALRAFPVLILGLADPFGRG